MDLPLFLLAFALFWKSSTSIQCFQCVAERTYTSFIEHTCEHFDKSNRFIVTCLNSTMCYKKVSTLDLGNGLSSLSFSRGCASQTVQGDQKKVNKKWVPANDIHEVYEEGCKPDATDMDRITKTTHCYCRGDLCNGSYKSVVQYIAALVMANVFLVINVLS